MNALSCINNKKNSYCLLVEQTIHSSFCQLTCKGNYLHYKQYLANIYIKIAQDQNLKLYTQKYKDFFSTIQQDLKLDYLIDIVNNEELTQDQALFIAQKENIQDYIQHAKKLKEDNDLYEKYRVLMLNMNLEQKEQYLIECVSSGLLTPDQALYISILENFNG